MKRRSLLAAWTEPYGGVPPFDKVRADMFPSAFKDAMEEACREIARIADDPAPPTFENTFVPLEDTRRAYRRAQSLWTVYTSTLNTEEVKAIDREWAPKFAAFDDEIYQNIKLFERIEVVYNSPNKVKLTPEQQRLAWFHHTQFVRQGARLSAEQKRQLSEYNTELAECYTKFKQNVLADEENYYLVLESQDDLKGLPQSVINVAAAAAAQKGLKGKWVIQNTTASMKPFLTYCDRRDLREKGWRMWTTRGDKDDAYDNNVICSEILLLRAKRAKLLGYPTHARWRLENTMAKTPEKAMELMRQVWPAAVARVREEVDDMQKIADGEGVNIKIEPWDYRYYMEKVRKAKYDLDEHEIRPYLQMDKIREGICWVSNQMFGFNWSEVRNVPVSHQDIQVWKVTRSDDSLAGLWYFDPFEREDKISGAWMFTYRAQEKFKGSVTPIVSNTCNFVKGRSGEPVLVSWDNAKTMFHEFGHAIHVLNSDVNYPTLSDIEAMPRDFVEFPAELNAIWMSTPEVLSQFALHYQTGESMPDELVAKIQKACTFNQGFETVEYLASAIIDMALHLEGEKELDMRTFEKERLAALGMPKEIVMFPRIPHFDHVFASDGYAAGYYSYLWSEVLAHDAYKAWIEEGGPYKKQTAKRYRDTILSRGNTLDAAEAYRNFRGRDPSIVPYLEYKGFPTTTAT